MEYRKGLFLVFGLMLLQGAFPAAGQTTTASLAPVSPAPASAASVAAAKAPTPWPLPANDYFLGKIPPPPAKDSPADQADLAYSVQVQAAATPAQIKQAVDIAVNLSVFSFSEVLGAKFTKANYPLTAAFFKRLDATANIPKNYLKDHYARARPYLAHPDQVKQWVPVDTGYSYPSGHVTRAELTALTLGYLDPDKKDALLGFVDQVAADRIIGGMHYRSDTAESKVLGQLVFAELMKEPKFVAALDALKAKEWAQAPTEAVAAH
jgi:acid phosphatase (class A)